MGIHWNTAFSNQIPIENNKHSPIDYSRMDIWSHTILEILIFLGVMRVILFESQLEILNLLFLFSNEVEAAQNNIPWIKLKFKMALCVTWIKIKFLEV